MTTTPQTEATPVPSYVELMTAPHRTFAGWCQGPMAYVFGDVLAAAAVCRLNNARGILERVLAEAGESLGQETAESIKEFLA